LDDEADTRFLRLLLYVYLVIKKVNKLLDEAERKLDVKLLEEACELIKTLPDGEEKKKLNKRAADIENKIIIISCK